MQRFSGQGVSPLLFAKRSPAAKETALRYAGTDTELDPKDGGPVLSLRTHKDSQTASIALRRGRK